MPGMTGPWQILGPARVPLREMVAIDYLYVANWSPWTDIKILLRTVPTCWDAHVPSLESLLIKYAGGPDRNTAAMLDAVEPVRGRRVLDFACGAGVTAAFLAQRGAIVTAIGPALERAGLQVEFVAGELTPSTFAPESFDAIVGHYALHHVDLNVIAPIFNELLVAGGRGGFVETMGLNPLLNFSRNRLAGRAGVASYGSEDERPLERSDLQVLEREIGPVELVSGEMRFLRIFDRNVLRYRWPLVSRALATVAVPGGSRLPA
jgi:SAM-dependent methyltransferase